FVAAKDVVEIMMRLMKSEIHRERFILNAEDWSYQKFLFQIADLLGKKRPYIRALPWMTELFWRLEAIRALFINHTPLISRETARVANRTCQFNAAKIKTSTGFEFTPLIKCMEETTEKFKEDVAAGKIK
ncbi:MAG: 3-beta hydroxysteroid dehydrogenase, partial [Chitinophagales bacterium]